MEPIIVSGCSSLLDSFPAGCIVTLKKNNRCSLDTSVSSFTVELGCRLRVMGHGFGKYAGCLRVNEPDRVDSSGLVTRFGFFQDYAEIAQVCLPSAN